MTQEHVGEKIFSKSVGNRMRRKKVKKKKLRKERKRSNLTQNYLKERKKE